MRTITKLVLLFIMLIAISNVQAQKLPNTQQGSFWAPANIKIDGKPLEWGSQFEAYNHATETFYTVSNDDNNFYLVIQATKPRVIDKIINVGITFVVNTAGKKNDNSKESVSVAYPHLDVGDGQRILINAGKKVKPDVQIPVINGRPVLQDTTDRLPKRTDSLVRVANKILVANARIITLKGIPEIADDTISVYNEMNIKAAAAFDKDGNYTYELAIPLKYLHLSNDMQKFNYCIKIPGRLVTPKRGMITRYIYPNGVAVDVDQDLDSTTDFWGEYTLAKKSQ